MEIVNFKAEEVKDLSIYDKLNIKKIEENWNKNSGFKDFNEFKILKKFNNFQAIKYIYENNLKEKLLNLDISKTKSKIEDDIEKIEIEFKDENEADKYFSKLKEFEPKSLLYNIEKEDNKINFYYSRLTLDNKKVYRTKSKRITKDAVNFDKTSLTSLNINSFELMKKLHEINPKLLVVYGSNVANSNDTLNKDDKEVEELREKFLYLKNKTQHEIKKENLSKRGSNNVSNNIKKDIQKDEIKEKVEKEIKKDIKSDNKIGSFETFVEIQKRIFDKKIEQLKNEENNILSSFDKFIKDGYSFDEAVNRLEKSYKNEFIKDLIINKLEDRNKENLELKEKLKAKDEDIEGLKEKIEEVVKKAEDEINDLTDKLDNVIDVAEDLEEENEKIREHLKEKDKEIYEKDKEIYNLNERLDKKDEEINEIKINLEKLFKENEKLNEVINNKNRVIDNFEKENKELKSDNSKLKDELKNVKKENEKLEKDNHQKDLKIVELETKVNIYSNLMDKNEEKEDVEKEEVEDEKVDEKYLKEAEELLNDENKKVKKQ